MLTGHNNNNRAAAAGLIENKYQHDTWDMEEEEIQVYEI